METSAEAAGDYRKPAASGRRRAAIGAFRQMATEWARLAFNEEFTLEERTGPPPSSESSEPTPAGVPASSLF